MSSKRRAAGSEEEALSLLTTRCSPLAVYVVAAMEDVLLALICWSPWAYGSAHPGFEFLLDAGIAVLLALWAARMLLEGQITWKKSTVAICLAVLFLLGIWQATPLPRPILAWLSPGTARCYDQLLPQQPERLTPLNGETAVPPADSDAAPPPDSTLSLYPGATQRETTRLLAVFLVFAVVLNNLTSRESLIRLSWVAVINGSLLSLFALFQFFAAPPYTVYWTFTTQVTPFGPFICHNHFPDYVNMCIGLGIGLLLSQGRHGQSSASEEQDFSPLQMLHNPRTLWICGALGLMLTAVAFSRSRGGLLALVGAAVICGVLGRLRLGLSYRLGSLLVVAGVVAAFFAWFGIDSIKNRLDTLKTGEALESRVPLWLRSLPIVPDFPIWGTGFGTFGYVEPMYRPDEPSWEGQWPALYDHAHSDYLEILVEGGGVGLGLAVLALAAVYRLGFRALTVNRGSRRAGLALGALFAFTALVLHCFGEFGAHIPAITLLATVVCAHLCTLGRSKPYKERSVEEDADSDTYRLRLGGVAPVFGAMVALGLGLLICADTWKAHRMNRLQTAALRAGSDEVDQLRTRIACLTEAVSLGPENALLHDELGSAHRGLAKLLGRGSSPDLGADLARQSELARLSKLLMQGDSPELPPELRAAHEQGKLAIREYLRARDACPLLFGAQLGIATYSSKIYMTRGDKTEDYFRRAKLLCPGQVEKWYECGLRESTLPPEDAWKSWKHCLKLSDRYLPEILEQTSLLPASVLLEKVLPDSPAVLLAAALIRYPEDGSVRRRRPFLQKALRLLESNEKESVPQDLLVKARIYKALERPDQAIPLYREFFNRDASQVQLRYEFASYLHAVHKLEEAHHELTVILAREPKYSAAKELRDAVSREIVEEKAQQRKRQQQDWSIRHRQR